jgi:hypothetical protein
MVNQSESFKERDHFVDIDAFVFYFTALSGTAIFGFEC